MNAIASPIGSLDELSGRYPVIFSDIWGVLHNGETAFMDSATALMRAREKGAVVVLITNSPRPRVSVVAQLASLGVPTESWDRIVTSGDVTRDLIANGPRKVFHLGPERDLNLYDGLDVEIVEEFEADAVCCTGYVDDDVETPEDYAEMLQRFRSRNLPFICANPDIVVERGDRLIWCAGALARDYGLLGGRTLIAGKPFRPIYDVAMQEAVSAAGRDIALSEILAIGDGMLTDVKGAIDYGLDLLYVSGGIHAREYGNAERADPARLAEFLAQNGREPVGIIHRLK